MAQAAALRRLCERTQRAGKLRVVGLRPTFLAARPAPPSVARGTHI